MGEQSKATEFVSLHNHTIFSLLDGIAHPNEYFKACAERKWPAIAITEHGVLSSIPDAYFASKEYNVKYIPAIEFYYSDYDNARKNLANQGVKINEWRRNNVELSDRFFRHRHLTVLAKNQTGYENILKMNLAAWKDGFYRKPRIWFDLLAKHAEGLIVLSGCLNSPICHELRNNNLTTSNNIIGALDYVDKFKKIFKEDFYIELQMPGVSGDVEIFRKLVTIADHFKIKCVMTMDTHYMKRDDFILQKVMIAIDQQMTVEDRNLFYVNSDEQFFKTRAELRATFHERGFIAKCPESVFEESCNNTLEIADKCSPFKPNLEPKLPRIENAEEKLRQMVEDGLRRKGLDKDESKYFIDENYITYREQMEIELNRIIEKNFASYFLIIKDLISASTNKGWDIGPGRGSISGSLVAYLIDLTSIDPIKWNLSFNRFMSPSRGGNMLMVTMPEETAG